MCIGGGAVILRGGIIQNIRQARGNIGKQVRIQAGQPVMQAAGIIIITDRRAAACENWASIQPLFHQHGADTGFGIASGNGPLDGCCSAPAR